MSRLTDLIDMCETTEFKTCSKCGQEKPLLAFHPKETGKFGVRADCRDCQNAKTRKRRRITGHAISDKAREAKRARERERQKRADVKLAKSAACVKYRSTEKYRLFLEKKRDQRLAARVGEHTAITIRTCICCSRVDVLRTANGHRLAATHCSACARKNSFTGLRHTPKQRTCTVCGNSFMGVAGALYCPAHKEAAIKVAKKNGRARRNAIQGRNHRSRARHYGCKAEVVNRLLVYARDKWKCYLCGRKVVQSATWKPNQATLDHVVPLSKGGSHTYDNVKTACHSCNSNKGGKILNDIQLTIFTHTQGP